MSAPLLYAFDFDGVVADSGPAYVRAINRVGHKLGATRRMNGELLSRMPDYQHHFSAELIGLPAHQLSRYSDELSQVFHHEQGRAELHTDVGGLLLELQRGAQLAIVSANDQAVIENAMQVLGVTPQQVFAGHGRAAKAEVLADLARHWRVVMIGDTLSDCRAAAAAKVDCVAVSWGWQGTELLSEAGVPLMHDSHALRLWLKQWSAPAN